MGSAPGSPSKWLKLALWGHLQGSPWQPGCFFPAVNLRCWNLPASVTAGAATLEIHERHILISQDVHNLFPTQLFFPPKWAQV